MKKRIIALFLFVFFISIFSGCAPKSLKEITTNVKIIDAHQNVLLDEICTLNKSRATAKDALVTVCQSQKISYQNNNGLFDGFMGISSTQEAGWLFYFNSELSEKGLQETLLDTEKENLIEIKYMNYAEAFQ